MTAQALDRRVAVLSIVGGSQPEAMEVTVTAEGVEMEEEEVVVVVEMAAVVEDLKAVVEPQGDNKGVS